MRHGFAVVGLGVSGVLLGGRACFTLSKIRDLRQSFANPSVGLLSESRVKIEDTPRSRLLR